MEIEKHWQEIFGEAIPPEVLTRILKIQKIMNIKDDDALWQILIPLEFYQRIHEQIPASMRAESEAVTRQVKEASATVIRSAVAEIEKGRADAESKIQLEVAAGKTALAKALESTLPLKIEAATQRIAEKLEKKGRGTWGDIAIAVIGMVLLVTVGGMAWMAGEDHGETAELQKIQHMQQRR